MTHAPLSTLDAKAIAVLSPEHLEPAAIALATEIDRLEALLCALQRRLETSFSQSGLLRWTLA